MVTSWADSKLEVLDLIVEPQSGLTRDFLTQSRTENGASLALFSGPYGVTAPVEQYESVIMMASGFGLVAQIPYLKRLIHGYTAGEISTRRLHLVWQIRSLGKYAPAKPCMKLLTENRDCGSGKTAPPGYFRRGQEMSCLSLTHVCCVSLTRLDGKLLGLLRNR